VNVVGVVSSFSPRRHVTEGYICSLSIIDESKLEVDCVMLHEAWASLPPQLYPGDIMFLSGVATEGLAPHVALKADRRSKWVVFVERDGFKPRCSSVDHRVRGRAENSRLEELKRWSTRDSGWGWVRWVWVWFGWDGGTSEIMRRDLVHSTMQWIQVNGFICAITEFVILLRSMEMCC